MRCNVWQRRPPALRTKHKQKINALLRELSDDKDEDVVTPIVRTDPGKPWIPGFKLYLDTQDHLNGMTIVQWWGVCAFSRPALNVSLPMQDERAPLSSLGFFGRRLPLNNGLVCLK